MTRAFLFLMLAPFAVAAAESSGPMAQLKATNDKIDKILKSKPVAGSPEEKKAKEDLKVIVNGLLDYQELAKRSLAQHWDEIGKQKQELFVSTLRELIEKNYVKQLRTNLDYAVSYKNESLKDGEALVNTVVKVKTRGKSTDSNIDYKLRKEGDKWLVFDIITDDVSMVKNYKQQFHKIITQDGFDKLISKMRKKIDEIQETQAGTAVK
jgi:phospholipid transport system substrate-binding protein